MAITNWAVRFVHKDDFVSTHNYLTTYSGDVAATYDGSSVFNFALPDPDSYIDSGSTFQSLPRPQRATFSLILDSWLQEHIIDAVDSLGNETEINGYSTHITLIYRVSTIGTETLVFTGAATFETGSTRSQELKFTIYDFVSLWDTALDSEVTIGILEGAGTVASISGSFNGDFEYEYTIDVSEDDTLPNTDDEVFFRFPQNGGGTITLFRDVINVNEDSRQFTIVSPSAFDESLLLDEIYGVRANHLLRLVPSLIEAVGSRALAVLQMADGAFNVVQDYSYQPIDSYTNEPIYATNYPSFIDDRATLSTVEFEQRAIGFYSVGDDIYLILYDYSFSYQTNNPPIYIFQELLKKKVILFSDTFYTIFVEETDLEFTGSSFGLPSYLTNGVYWGTFETSISSSIVDSEGNTYALSGDSDQVLFTGSLFIRSISPEYGEYTLKRLWEALAYFNQLTLNRSANGNLTITQKYRPEDLTPISLTVADIVADSRLIPYPKAIHFDRQRPDFSFLFSFTEGENEWFGIEEAIDAIELQFRQYFPQRRGIDLEYSANGFTSGVNKGDVVVLDDIVYYCHEVQSIGGVLSKRFKIGFWDVSANYSYSGGSPVIISTEVQSAQAGVGIPIINNTGGYIRLSDGTYWVRDTGGIIDLPELDFSNPDNSFYIGVVI